MYAFLTRFIRSRRGVAVIEFGLFLPLFMMLVLGVVEYGRLLSQTNAVEKGVRAGAMLASRGDFPITAAQLTSIENLVKTGNVDGTGNYLAPGWTETGASVTITNTLFSSAGVVNLPVIRVKATVPYKPIIQGLLNFAGVSNLTIEATHEQAYLGG